ncbi:hypothetical protein BDV97DRAFT_292892 [Delphinella strobiligena]|nr:hypothetical protein BDV97DRAFT_292892 [Delphinella strobiligena]
MRSLRAEQWQKRRYASIANDGRDYSHLRWPEAPNGHQHPTPYQIFSLQQSEPYSKQRFYELVKIYHPDRGSPATPPSVLPGSHPCHNIAHGTKLERYRLIVAAHGILSDPEKRRAYDSFGAGWAGAPGNGATSNPWGRPGTGTGTPPGPFSGWREGTDPNIWANATWEDWERFYAARDPSHPSHQAPTYIRNSYFITIVMVLALVGSTANYGRAEVNGERFLEARDAMHDRAAKDLRKVRQQSESRPKEERIQFFLRQREATMTGLGVEEVRQDKLSKILPQQETCMSELDEDYERRQEEGRIE